LLKGVPTADPCMLSCQVAKTASKKKAAAEAPVWDLLLADPLIQSIWQEDTKQKQKAVAKVLVLFWFWGIWHAFDLHGDWRRRQSPSQRLTWEGTA
jgi:hypothetical protein